MAQTLLGIKKSSNVLPPTYNDRTHTLTVPFVSGATYDYANVPAKVAKGMMDAKSAGEYFAEHIKHNYTATKKV